MTVADVMDAIEALRPMLLDHAQEAEELRRLPEPVVDAIGASGVLTMLQPASWGGLEADPRDYFRAVMRIASACGSTGWVAGIVGVHPWEVAAFAPEAQQEVWAEDPRVWICSSYMPTGVAKSVDGGYAFSGRWSFGSGVLHSGWALVGGVIEADGDRTPAHFLLPASDYSVKDTWHVAGLGGTGSNDIVAADAFVPAHRVLTRSAVHAGTGPGFAVHDAPLYRLPWATIFPNAIRAAVVGIAEGALEAHLEYQAGRVSKLLGRVADSQVTMSAIAPAASDIAASRLQLLESLGTMLGYVERDEEIPLPVRAEARRDQVHGAWRAVRAVDELFARSGGNALRLGTRLQRLWRDCHAGLAHAINVPDTAFRSYASVAIGNEPLEEML